MNCKTITNISQGTVTLKERGGADIALPPGAQVKNVDVTNINQVSGSVKFVGDLSEVHEKTPKTKLFD